MCRPDRPHDWAPRRADPPPAELVRALGRRYAHGALLAALLWQRDVASEDRASGFLEPSLARGLRPPATDGPLQRFAAALAAVPGGVRVEASADADLATALAAVGIAEQCDAADGATLRLGARHWEVDVGDGAPTARWTPGAHDDDLPPESGIATAALYLLAALRRHRRLAGDARRVLDVLALVALAEADTVPVRDEQRTIAVLGLAHLSQRPGMRALLEAADLRDPAPWLVQRRLLPRLEAAWVGHGLAGLRPLFATADAAAAEESAVRAAMTFARRLRATSSDERASNAARIFDAELALGALSPGLARALARLEPHGRGNPEPVFLARAIRFDGARLAGDLSRPYQRVRLRQDGRTVRAVAFGFGVIEPAPEQRFDVLYGVRSIAGGLETRLVAVRPTEESTS